MMIAGINVDRLCRYVRFDAVRNRQLYERVSYFQARDMWLTDLEQAVRAKTDLSQVATFDRWLYVQVRDGELDVVDDLEWNQEVIQ